MMFPGFLFISSTLRAIYRIQGEQHHSGVFLVGKSNLLRRENCYRTPIIDQLGNPVLPGNLVFPIKVNQINQINIQTKLKHFCGSTKFLNTSLYCAGRAKYKLINLSSLNKENRIYIRGEFTSKKRKTAILLYCFYNAGVFHIFVLYNLLGP